MKNQTHEETFDLDYKGTSLNPLNGKTLWFSNYW